MARKQAAAGRKVAAGSTPVRAALVSSSVLHEEIKDGLGAVKSVDRDYLAPDVRTEFADSLELDAAMESDHAQDHRWDYLLGHAATSALVGVEPHSAKTDQISRVIRKKQAAQGQLRSHLRPGKKVELWLWVASGKVEFSPYDRAVRQLAEQGITFAGRQVQQKHLAKLGGAAP